MVQSIKMHTTQAALEFRRERMPGKWIVFRDKSKKFRFRLLASNGEIIAVGEAYESKAACMNGIRSIQKHSQTAKLIDETIMKEEELAAAAKKKADAKKKAAAKKKATKADAKKTAAKKTAAKKAAK
jgi:hypothetical protein